MLSKSDTQNSAMSNIANFMFCSFMKLIYKSFSCISVLSQAELGMQLKTQLNWDQNCIFTEWNELDVKSAMFDMAEFWVSDFESIRFNLGALLVIIDTKQCFLSSLKYIFFIKMYFRPVRKIPFCLTRKCPLRGHCLFPPGWQKRIMLLSYLELYSW